MDLEVWQAWQLMQSSQPSLNFSLREFCKRNGLPVATLVRWIKNNGPRSPGLGIPGVMN